MFITKDTVNTAVAFDLAGKTTVFGQESGSSGRTGMVLQTFPGKVFRRNRKLPEIIVNADKIAAALIKPAAGGINQPCWIQLPDHVSNAHGIELSPALVERTVDGDGREEIQVFYSSMAFQFKQIPVNFIFPGKQAVMVIPDLVTESLGHGGKITRGME